MTLFSVSPKKIKFLQKKSVNKDEDINYFLFFLKIVVIQVLKLKYRKYCKILHKVSVYTKYFTYIGAFEVRKIQIETMMLGSMFPYLKSKISIVEVSAWAGSKGLCSAQVTCT